MRVKSAGPRKPRPITMAGTGISSDSNKNLLLTTKNDAPKPPIPKSRNPDKARKPSQLEKVENSEKNKKPVPSEKPEKLKKSCKSITKPAITPQLQSPTIEQTKSLAVQKQTVPPTIENAFQSKLQEIKQESKEDKNLLEQSPPMEVKEEIKNELTPITSQPEPSILAFDEMLSNDNPLENAGMTASMIAKIRITTEEEAKAALAERRKLAREEVERQALAEKLRLEQEEEHQRQEEEQLRKLAEEQRKAEEERLQQVRLKYYIKINCI